MIHTNSSKKLLSSIFSSPPVPVSHKKIIRRIIIINYFADIIFYCLGHFTKHRNKENDEFMSISRTIPRWTISTICRYFIFVCAVLVTFVAAAVVVVVVVVVVILLGLHYSHHCYHYHHDLHQTSSSSSSSSSSSLLYSLSLST